MAEKKAVLLLSGGIDSSTTLACAVRDRFDTYALTIDYGQRHRAELDSAKTQATDFGAKEHVVLHVDLRPICQSALTAGDAVPTGRAMHEISHGIPATYVPARNTIFLSLALGWAESIGTGDIFIGVNALDYSGYPDCRPEFVRAFERAARLGTKMGAEGTRDVTIHTPLISMTKAEIFRLGHDLGVDFANTNSCYDPDERENPCGACDSCLLRAKGFKEAGLIDPLAGGAQ